MTNKKLINSILLSENKIKLMCNKKNINNNYFIRLRKKYLIDNINQATNTQLEQYNCVLNSLSSILFKDAKFNEYYNLQE